MVEEFMRHANTVHLVLSLGLLSTAVGGMILSVVVRNLEKKIKKLEDGQQKETVKW